MFNALDLAEFALKKQKEDLGIPPMSEAEIEEYESAEFCPYCKRHFAADGLTKVRHHIHSAGSRNYGQLIGATCNDCNLQLRLVIQSYKNM